MTRLLEGKVALITGGARGQGRAHAVACAREGADVVITDTLDAPGSVTYPWITQDDVDHTAGLVEKQGRSALAILADVRSQDDLDSAVEQAVARFGRVDIAIANAGIFNRVPLWEMPEAVWQEMLDINLTGVWRTIKAVAPQMIKQLDGSIVITSSVNGLLGAPDYAHYASAKHGLVGLMRSAALELGRYGIRCNSIHPGVVKTGMVMHQANLDMVAGHPGATSAEFDQATRGYFALRGQTAMEPEVIADAAVLLNSDLWRGVTGVTVPVEAGHLQLSGHNWAPA